MFFVLFLQESSKKPLGVGSSGTTTTTTTTDQSLLSGEINHLTSQQVAIDISQQQNQQQTSPLSQPSPSTMAETKLT